MTRRVVITGLGPISSIGTGAASFHAGLLAGRSGVSPIASFDSSGFPHIMGGEVHDFAPESILTRLDVQQWGRTSLFAAAAARLAVHDAGLDEDDLRDARAWSCMGTTGGESQVLEQLTHESLTGGFAEVEGARFAQVPSSRLTSAVNQELGLSGEAFTFSTACSASNYAVGYAFDAITAGETDCVIAGGADSVGRWSHAGFFRLGAIAEKQCRPFDKDRTGIITGEGGAAVVVEAYDHAVARGARIYAEVLGYGVNCDADHMTAPNKDSIVRCMQLAHADAGVTAADIDYISAHGTGTPANDLTEGTAITEVFEGAPPPVSSIKSMLGHTMGAASAFNVIATMLAIEHSFLPPTINFSEVDPRIAGIDPVPNQARPATVKVAQVNGFAFGGNNAITIFGSL